MTIISTNKQMRSQSYNSPSLPNVPHSKPLSSTTLTHTHTLCLNPTTKPLHKTCSLPRPLSTVVSYGTIPKVLRGHESLCFHRVHTHCSKTPCTAYLHWPWLFRFPSKPPFAFVLQLQSHRRCLLGFQQHWEYRNVFSWNTMISGFVDLGRMSEAEKVFDRCLKETLFLGNFKYVCFNGTGWSSRENFKYVCFNGTGW